MVRHISTHINCLWKRVIFWLFLTTFYNLTFFKDGGNFWGFSDRYQVAELVHRATTRARQERETLPMSEIKKILDCDFMKETFNAALNARTHKELATPTSKDFVNLRNALIVRLTIGSLCWVMEFRELTLGEFNDREKTNMPDGSIRIVVRIARHKTATKGKQPE